MKLFERQAEITHTHTLWERAELIKIQLNTFQQYFRQWYKFLARHYNYISGFPAVRGGIFNMLAHTRSHTHTHTDKFAHQYICQTICRLIKFFFSYFYCVRMQSESKLPEKVGNSFVHWAKARRSQVAPESRQQFSSLCPERVYWAKACCPPLKK